MSALALGPILSTNPALAQGESSPYDNPLPQRTARASANAEVTGTVLGIDEDDIVIDLGSNKGAVDGNVVQIWRPFKLRHPVTGQTLTDRFRIGSLRLVQVQKALTMARPEGSLARKPAPGDVVIMARPIAAAPAQEEDGATEGRAARAGGAPSTVSSRSGEAKQPSETPSSAGTTREGVSAGVGSLDPEARELCLLFDALKGQPIPQRIVRYEQYLKRHPQGTYARVLGEEAAALRQLLTEQGERRAEEAADSSAVFAPPPSAQDGEPLTIGIELPAAKWTGAVLHARHAGEVAYQSLPMRSAGGRYFRVVVAAEQIKAPELDYFIEAVNANGVAYAIVGTSEAPQRLEVHEGAKPLAYARPLASASVFTDYADYNRLRGNDYAWQTEGQFGLRYADKGVRAVRSGFGVYRGVGGSVEELDVAKLKPRHVGLTYGYLEGEFGVSRVVGLIGRLALGLNDDGVNAGGQLFVRLGNDRATNLLLGGEVLGGIGTRGIAELQWNTLPRVPIVFRTEVTNQPAGATARGQRASQMPDTSSQGGDIGARAVVQAGYRVVPELVVALRASYEGRTIQHAGPGAGAGVTYTW